MLKNTWILGVWTLASLINADTDVITIVITQPVRNNNQINIDFNYEQIQK